MKYRLAIFDFDGTLADSFPWFVRTSNEMADRYGFRRIETHELPTLRGYDARRMIAHVGMPMWKLPLIARHVRRRMAAEIGEIALFPGVGEMLRGLHDAGIGIAVVTSNSEANVRRVLGEANAALVRHYGCGASMFGKRPKIRQVLRAAGVAPHAALSIGDEIRDIHASRAERVPFGAVAWGYTTLESLRAHSPELIFSTMDQIVERLTRG